MFLSWSFLCPRNTGGLFALSSCGSLVFISFVCEASGHSELDYIYMPLVFSRAQEWSLGRGSGLGRVSAVCPQELKVGNFLGPELLSVSPL